MRLFIALDLPDEVRAWVAERQRELEHLLSDPKLRWTTPVQWHITLRFLGETPEHKIPAITSAMKRTAEGTPPFKLSLGKVGTFSGSRMGVLWLGIEEGLEPLKVLAEHLNQNLAADPARIPFDLIASHGCRRNG